MRHMKKDKTPEIESHTPKEIRKLREEAHHIVLKSCQEMVYHPELLRNETCR